MLESEGVFCHVTFSFYQKLLGRISDYFILLVEDVHIEFHFYDNEANEAFMSYLESLNLLC